MASLSLPKVLQPRRTSLEQDRENFEKFQTVSIGKAINQQENPVKEKHVRSAIIGTFQEKGAVTFWAIVTKLPLQGNPIVAWKFCHVLHKVMREGHQHVVPDSQRYRKMIEELGKLWGHLKEGYGKLIHHYSRLLVTKMNFHHRNPRFPGNLKVTDEELDNIGENDINLHFQMSVEMFDYMDEILALQAAVFGSLDMSRANSMTSAGQCRLAPLIPCIQDSSYLYDYCVKILFKLHASLPADTLAGHRERFLKEFKVLRQFYLSSSTLQYFKHLIQVPLLPDNPPNFLIAAEIHSHVTPVVRLPPEENESESGDIGDDLRFEEAVSDLVDLGETNGSSSPDVSIEKDRLIDQLRQEIERLKAELVRMSLEYQREIRRLQERIRELEMIIAEKESRLIQERQAKEVLSIQMREQSSLADVVEEQKKQAKTNEEKFQKMKNIYQSLREEHIQLLRQKADTYKQLTSVRQAFQETQRLSTELEGKLQLVAEDRRIAQEALQQSASDKDNQIEQLIAAKESAVEEKLRLEGMMEGLGSKKLELEDRIQCLETEVQKMSAKLENAEQLQQLTEKKSHETLLQRLRMLLEAGVNEAVHIIQTSVNELESPTTSGVKCMPEYYSTLAEPVLEALTGLTRDYGSYLENPDGLDRLVRDLSLFAHLVGSFLVQGKGTSQTSPDIEKGDDLLDACRGVGSETLAMLTLLKSQPTVQKVGQDANTVKCSVEKVMFLVQQMIEKGNPLEQVGDLELELSDMDKAIEEAASRIQEMLHKSREADTGVKLEVNAKILDACTNLMKAIKLLVQKAKALQAEIVAQGRGTASVKEFYKRNHRWTEGLLSAAKAVGSGAKFLVDAADKVVKGQAKFEQLMVASQEIAASTAQLVVSSRVKADQNSQCLAHLSHASKGVTEATGNVVATAKSCSEMIEEGDVMDFTRLTLHQAKCLEMESQVKVLELESALTKERLKLSGLRKQHYRLGGENEGWEEADIPQ